MDKALWDNLNCLRRQRKRKERGMAKCQAKRQCQEDKEALHPLMPSRIRLANTHSIAGPPTPTPPTPSLPSQRPDCPSSVVHHPPLLSTLLYPLTYLHQTFHLCQQMTTLRWMRLIPWPQTPQGRLHMPK
jgi:hypothetical protein